MFKKLYFYTLRGNSLFSRIPRYTRCARRYYTDSHFYCEDFGFRLAKVPSKALGADLSLSAQGVGTTLPRRSKKGPTEAPGRPGDDI